MSTMNLSAAARHEKYLYDKSTRKDIGNEGLRNDRRPRN